MSTYWGRVRVVETLSKIARSFNLSFLTSSLFPLPSSHICPSAGMADLFPRVVVCAGYKKIPLPVKGEELFVLYGLCAEVIVEDILRRYAETVEHLQN